MEHWTLIAKSSIIERPRPRLPVESWRGGSSWQPPAIPQTRPPPRQPKFTGPHSVTADSIHFMRAQLIQKFSVRLHSLPSRGFFVASGILKVRRFRFYYLLSASIYYSCVGCVLHSGYENFKAREFSRVESLLSLSSRVSRIKIRWYWIKPWYSVRILNVFYQKIYFWSPFMMGNEIQEQNGEQNKKVY